MKDRHISLDAAIATIMEYSPGNTINDPKYAAGKSLVEALSALPAVAGWLPISDEAKKLGCVIACRAGQEDSVGPVWWKRSKWTIEDGETWREGWLTHYMPLPTPPEIK